MRPINPLPSPTSLRSLCALVCLCCVSLLTSGCTKQLAFDTTQAWQRQQCFKLDDVQQRQRCLKDTSGSYDDYQRRMQDLGKQTPTATP